MFNPYAAGKKTYGGGRSAPNIGPVDPIGYRDRDAERKRKKERQQYQNAAMQKLQAMKNRNYFSADWQRVMGPKKNG